MKKFEFLEHTADIKFKAYGKSKKEVFENCVLAVSNVLSREQEVKKTKKKEVSFKGKDDENLLYKLLEEEIYLFDAEGFLVSGSKVDIVSEGIRIIFEGDSTENYEGLNHIKSVTYNEMFVKKEGSKWAAQVVLDI